MSAERSVDVLVVGGGPAGLATATELARLGAGRVQVLDREPVVGGIPVHCHHTGFGLRDLHRSMSGPTYARRLTDLAVAAGVDIRTEVSVTGWTGPLAVATTSPLGLEQVQAAAVVLATGARERPRSAQWVPGDRPAGVLTTGQLQRTVYEHGLSVGTRAVVVGAEHVSFSAVLTLQHAGVPVVAMLTRWARHQSYAAFRLAAAARYRFPLLTGTRVVRIVGRDRVEAVEVVGPDGTVRAIACDTVVFTGSWIGEHELARAGGLVLDPTGTAPVVDTGLRTARWGVVVAGNLAHPVLTADAAALDAEVAAQSVLEFLGEPRPEDPLPEVDVTVRGGESVRMVVPGRVRADLVEPPRGRFVLWADDARRRPEIEVRQGGRLLSRSRSLRSLVPDRPYDVPAGWVGDVEVPGPDVTVTVH